MELGRREEEEEMGCLARLPRESDSLKILSQSSLGRSLLHQRKLESRRIRMAWGMGRARWTSLLSLREVRSRSLLFHLPSILALHPTFFVIPYIQNLPLATLNPLPSPLPPQRPQLPTAKLTHPPPPRNLPSLPNPTVLLNSSPDPSKSVQVSFQLLSQQKQNHPRSSQQPNNFEQTRSPRLSNPPTLRLGLARRSTGRRTETLSSS